MNTWDLYFASLVGMTLHPGYNRENAKQPTLQEIATLADQMIQIREERQCQDGTQQ